MDIFAWSMPFVIEKTLDVLMNILKKPADEDNEAPVTGPKLSTVSPEMAEKMKKRDILRNRVKFVGKMALMMKTLREERETIVKLKGLAPDNKIPMGLLTQGHDAMASVLDKFSNARNADLKNEKRPD